MQTARSTATPPKLFANHASGQAVEDAITWLNAMGERGVYNATTARLASSSITQLVAVLREDEVRDAKAVLDNLDSLGNRLCILKNAVPATVKTYISRARLALTDYVQYRANPTGFRARTSSLRGAKSEVKKKKVPSAIGRAEARLDMTDGRLNGLSCEQFQTTVRKSNHGSDGRGYPVRLYLCYAAQDKQYQEEIERHLSICQRQGMIESWHAGLIQPGTIRNAEQQRQLAASRVVVLLVSPDLLATDGLYAQIESSLTRSTSGEAIVIPILIRAVDLTGTLLEQIQALPKNGKPINQWSDRDEAWKNVASEIRGVVLKMVNGHDRAASSRQMTMRTQTLI